MEVKIYDFMEAKEINRKLGYMHMQLFSFDEKIFLQGSMNKLWNKKKYFSFFKTHAHTLKIYQKTENDYSENILMQTKFLMQDSKYYSKNKKICFSKRSRGQTWQEEEQIHSQTLPKMKGIQPNEKNSHLLKMIKIPKRKPKRKNKGNKTMFLSFSF